jgi:hypothetical protein
MVLMAVVVAVLMGFAVRAHAHSASKRKVDRASAAAAVAAPTAVARPAGWTVFFKGGWRGTVRGQLVHQVARLERHGQTISIAVMTDGDPDIDYGIDTIRGVTSRLLGVTR